MTARLAGLSARKLTAALKQCGLTSPWSKAVIERRPFASDAEVFDAVESTLLRLGQVELSRALEAMPVPAVESANPDVREAALLALRLYHDRFGYAFVSAIDAPTADELLMRVRIRLGNEPEPEGRAAREHLRRVVRARLQKQIDPEVPA